MAFNRVEQVNPGLEMWPIVNTDACEQGDFAKDDGSGNATKASALADADDFLGVFAEAKEASDGKIVIGVLPPEAGHTFRGSLNTSTTVAVGDKLQISAAKTLKKSMEGAIAEVVKGESSALDVRYKLLPRAKKRGVSPIKSISQTFLMTDMTDGGSTSGYIDLTEYLPVGALVVGWRFDTLVAFNGDTSATIQVGVSGDVDRFSVLTTNSVFAAGMVGGQPQTNASAMVATRVQPRITITSAADFTNVAAAGQGKIQIFYIETAP